MTAVTVEPRGPQLTEMGHAALEAARAESPEHREYWRGVMVGYAVAFDLTDDGPLVDARNTVFAAALPLEEIDKKFTWLATGGFQRRPDVWHRAGILWGWKQATAERQDAQECAFCEQRILTDSDTEAFKCRNHGWLCNDDCRRTMCEARTSCWEDV